MESEIVGGAVTGLNNLWEYGALVTVLTLFDMVLFLVVWLLWKRNQALEDRLLQVALDGQKAMNEFSHQLSRIADRVEK